jgi:hypothetical protein
LKVHTVPVRAGLMPKDELDMIINEMRPIMKAVQPGVPDTWDNLYAFFLNRVRDNLHVMLCFSPVGNKFSTRAQQFPGLINGCTIDWFLPWPEEALTSGESWPCTKSLTKQQQQCGRLSQCLGWIEVRILAVLAVLLLQCWVMVQVGWVVSACICG